VPLAPGAPGKVEALIADIQETETTMEVNLQRSKLLRTRFPVSRVSIVNPSVIEVVQYGPQEFELIGRAVGQTTMTFWFGGLEQTPVLRYQVMVTRDPEAVDQRKLEYVELQKMVNEMFPNSMVFLVPVADKLIVKGQARDSDEATQIMSLITGRGVNQQGGLLIGPIGGVAAAPFPDSSLPTSSIINLLEVPGEQQVMLKVRVAELSRTALRDMSVSWNAIIGNNSFLVSLLSGSPNVVSVLRDGDVQIFMRLLSTNGMSKILAEPNLVTLSGHPASFIAGGEFAVPTIVGVSGASAATTQFRGFGAQLTFTPTVIDKDRIRLQVSPEFSQLNQANSVNGIPGLNTRAATTTVEMREGQWLAIAGLVQDEQTGTSSRIPFVGDVPVLRSVFGNKTVRRGETELIVLVSPELVHAIEPEELPPLLPGMEITEPNDLRFYLCGQLEGPPDCHHRSTVYPKYHDDIKEARRDTRHGRRYQKCQDYYLSGPHGFSD
jgi:pilus assembly protein CpaC